MDFELRWNLQLTPKAQTNGVTTLLIENGGVEGDWDITSPGGHMVMTLRGAHLKGTLDDVVTMDTEKEIGAEQAREVKKEIMAIYLKGDMDMDARGNVTDIRGEAPFVEFWREILQTEKGLFGIVFPEEDVPVGGSWKESITMKKMGQVALEGKGLKCNLSFTRQPDVSRQDQTLQVYKLEAPFKEKDLTGNMERGGQRMTLQIDSFSRRATGTINFDQAKGRLAESVLKAEGEAAMSTDIQGQTLKMDLTVEAVVSLRLLPAKPLR